MLPHFPVRSTSIILTMSWSYYPADAETSTVWAVPRSLATTGGITFVFFSYRYLDVSVPCVCLPYGIIHLQCIGVIPFGNPRVNGYLHLYAAYRSLSRPSSPLRAKASTIRPCLFTLIHAYSLFTVFRLLLISLLVVHIFICTICCGLYSNRFFPKCQRTAYLNGTVTG